MPSVSVRTSLKVVSDKIFVVCIVMSALPSSSEKWIEEFPDGFEHTWEFDTLLGALRFQAALNKKYGLDNPLKEIIN